MNADLPANRRVQKYSVIDDRNVDDGEGSREAQDHGLQNHVSKRSFKLTIVNVDSPRTKSGSPINPSSTGSSSLPSASGTSFA